MEELMNRKVKSMNKERKLYKENKKIKDINYMRKNYKVN